MNQQFHLYVYMQRKAGTQTHMRTQVFREALLTVTKR
jgi:hypothetical protein